MAYARFAYDCDVYVYEDARGGYTCERCPKIGETFRCVTAAEMVTHLLEQHRANGHRVPDDVFDAHLGGVKRHAILTGSLERARALVGEQLGRINP